jgi:hypothetical protein
MVTMAIAALILGVTVGLRYSVWGLLAFLSAVVLAMPPVMMLSSIPLASAAVATMTAISTMQIGFLAGAYSTQIGFVRRSLHLGPSVVNQ